jgi:medium-chain acyl-[acyl-carrier-protein] hydrolase
LILGSGAEYTQWHKLAAVPDWIEIIAVMMPGRSTRFGDDHINNMDELVKQITDSLVQTGRVAAGGKPFAFYGHSMGTYLGLEVMRSLRRRGLPLPLHFFAAASSEPSVRTRRALISNMTNDDIKKMLKCGEF